MKGAQKSIDLIKDEDKDSKARANCYVAEYKGKKGDVAGARENILKAIELMSRVQDPNEKANIQFYIASAQAGISDVAGAFKTLSDLQMTVDLVKDVEKKNSLQKWLSIYVAKYGNYADAQKAANRIQDAGFLGYKVYAQTQIARYRAAIGDIVGAKKILADAQKTVEVIQADSTKAYSPSHIANAYSDVAHTQVAIAEVMAKSGDMTGAQQSLVEAIKTADLIQSEEWKRPALESIFEIRARYNLDLRERLAAEWVKKLDDGVTGNDCPLNTTLFLDLPGYLKSLPSTDAQTIFDGEVAAAKKLVQAQNVIHKMLKQQGIKP